VKIHALAPFSAAGGKAVHYPGGGYYGFTAFKNASPDRVKEMLRIVDYLAAPFGSQESLLLEYGVEGTDFTFDANGTPVLTDQGKNDVLVPWNAIGERPAVLYKPNAPEFAQVAQADEKALMPLGVADPTLGLYSETNQDVGANIGATLSAGLSDIILSRRPMSDYDQIIQDWRSSGGDQIRTELQQAYAAAPH
jgi:putative aldouronate transport system substrate-binding protein